MLVKIVGQAALRSTIQKAVHVPASNTPAVITIAGVAGRQHWLHNIQWSYNGDPAGGRLTVVCGVTTRFDIDILVGGPGGFSLEIVADDGQDMVITLAAGGVGVTGKLNAQYSTETNKVEYVG